MSVVGSDPAILDVSEFIRSCVERAGGAVEAGPGGRLGVLLPPGLEAAAGGRSWVSLALATDLLIDGAEPATLGSPFVDALIAYAAGRGTVSSGHLPAGRLKRKGLREEVERTLRFSNCRTRCEDEEGEVMLSASAEFDFKVAFISEERRERIHVVVVNLFSNQVNPALAARLSELPVEAEPEWKPREAPLIPVETAYETACRALGRVVREDAARQQVRVGQRFAVEFARVSDYYAQLIEELGRRRVRELRRSGEARPAVVAAGAGAGGPAAEPRSADHPAGSPEPAVPAGALAQKVEAARRERERKLRELGETYGIRTRARLASVRCLWQPKAFFKLLIDRGSITRTLTLAYDGLLERLEPPSCESCREETTRLRATSEARLLCPECSGE